LKYLPELDSVAPSTVSSGDEVTLTGQYFGGLRGTVSIGGKRAKVLSWTDSAVTVRLPGKLAAGSQPVTLKTKLGSTTSAVPLQVE
jgi:hypothetical protein